MGWSDSGSAFHLYGCSVSGLHHAVVGLLPVRPLGWLSRMVGGSDSCTVSAGLLEYISVCPASWSWSPVGIEQPALVLTQTPVTPINQWKLHGCQRENIPLLLWRTSSTYRYFVNVSISSIRQFQRRWTSVAMNRRFNSYEICGPLIQSYPWKSRHFRSLLGTFELRS